MGRKFTMALFAAIAVSTLACGSNTVVHVDDDDGFSSGVIVGGSAGSTSAGGMGTSSSTGPGGGGGTTVPVLATGLEANDVISDPLRSTFYATIASTDQSFGNSLVVIDVDTGNVLSSVFVGSDPWRMALSDDLSTLWVSLKGSYSIRRIDLTTEPPSPGPTYDLPLDQFNNQAYAGPMVVLPGTTESVAVSQHRVDVSPSYAGTIVLDAGVPRPNALPGHTGASRLTSGPPGWLFGFNDLSTGFGFYAIVVDPSGVTSSEHKDLADGFSTDITYHDGRVYASNGSVVDVSNPSQPTKAGQFPHAGPIAVVDGGNAVLMMTDGFEEQPMLRQLDTATFTVAGEVPLSDGALDDVFRLTTPDGDHLAFIHREDFDTTRLYLATNPL